MCLFRQQRLRLGPVNSPFFLDDFSAIWPMALKK